MKELQVSFGDIGREIRGMLHLPEGKGKYPCVVFFHGLTESKNEAMFLFRNISRELLKSGIASLRMDYRGMGDSDGESRNMTVWTQLKDAASGVEYVLRRKEIDNNKIGLYGMHSGGYLASAIAGLFPVKSIVFLDAALNYRAYWEHKVLNGRFGSKSSTKKSLDLNGLQIGNKYLQSIRSSEKRYNENFKEYKGTVLIINKNKKEARPGYAACRYVKIPAIKIKKMVFAGENNGLSVVSQSRERIITASCRWFESKIK